MNLEALVRVARDSTIVLASIVVGLVLVEALLNAFWPDSGPRGVHWFAGSAHPRFMVQSDTAAGYVLRPNYVGKSESPSGQFRVDVSIDEWGLRDQPHGAGERSRVLMLGDSMTFGQGVSIEDAYPAVIESLLRNEKCSVYNAGVPGYSSKQMSERLQRLVPIVQPDLVTVALDPVWDMDRLERPFTYLEGFIIKSGWEPRLVLVGDRLYAPAIDLPIVGQITIYLQAHSRVYQVLRRALRSGYHLVRDALPGAGASDSFAAADYIEVVESIARMRDVAATLDVPFLPVLLEGRNAARRELNDALAKRLRALGIGVLRIDELAPASDWDPRRFPNDGHWNEEGHRAVGSALAPVILRELEMRGALSVRQ